MRKYIAMLLALTCLLLLAACGGSKSETPSAQPSDGAQPSGSEQPAQAQGDDQTAGDVQSRLDKGETVLVGFAVSDTSNPFLLAQTLQVKEMFEAIGVTFDYTSCDSDDAKMITVIENYITMGAELIICSPTNQDAVKDALLGAENVGIPVVCMGQHPSYADQLSGGTYVDWFAVGYQLGKLASAWIDETYPDAGPGDIHAANFAFFVEGIFVIQNDGMMQAVSEDPRITITYEQQDANTLDGGFDAMETAMTRDPDIRLVLAWQESPGIGGSNYVLSQPNLDPAEFAVFAAGIQSMGVEQIEQSKTNDSIYRGVVAYGTYGSAVEIPSAAGLYYVARDVLFGIAPVMPYWSEDDRWSLNSFGFVDVFDNPLNDFLIELYS